MNKLNKPSMFLLWAGAAISITEIYTGGMFATLGLQNGIIAIIIGHIIGTALLAIGGYISFKNQHAAMESVKFYMGNWGAKVIAFLNVLQLLGWAVIMVIQGGRALNFVFPSISYNIAIFVMALIVFIWTYFFSNFSKMLNDISVVLLLLLCSVLFFKTGQQAPVATSNPISFATAVELAIAMPVSWLPLIGDYTIKASDKSTSYKYSFWGYFIGSVLMFSLGLYITVLTGKDIIEFIATSYVKWLACIVIVLSTATTTFMDIYSAVLSSKQIFNLRQENLYLIIYSILVTIIAYIFPMEQYQNFLLIIGSVFVPVYVVVFLEYFLKKQQELRKINVYGILSAIIGVIIYYYLNTFSLGIPTLIVLASVSLIYFGLKIIFERLYKI